MSLTRPAPPSRDWHRLAVLSLLLFVMGGIAALAGGQYKKKPDGQPGAQLRGSEEFLDSSLDQVVSLEFREKPLDQVIDSIAKTYNVPLKLDLKALANAQIEPGAPISYTRSEITLRSGLHRMLRTFDFELLPKSEQLLITTRDIAENAEFARVYDVAAIIGLKPRTDDSNSLIDLIGTTIAPTSWPDGTGPTRIAFPLHGALVISQTYDVHRSIAALLKVLHETMRLDFSDAEAAKPRWADPLLTQEIADRLEAQLSQKVAFKFDNIPLSEAVRRMSSGQLLPIELDLQVLEEAGTAAGTLVSLDAEVITFAAALQRLVDSLELAWVPVDETILITTRDKAADSPLVCVYPVGDLVDHDNELVEDLGPHVSLQDLTNLVELSVEPDSWGTLGGSGSIRDYPLSDVLVAAQSYHVHRKVSELLAQVRAVQRGIRGASRADKLQADPDKLILKAYKLKLPPGHDGPADLAEVVKTVQDTIRPETWNNSGTLIRIVAGRLLVRQAASVHKEIAALLHELDIQQSAFERRLGGGFHSNSASDPQPNRVAPKTGQPQ